MLGQFDPAAERRFRYWVVWTCVLAADACGRLESSLQLAEKAVADNPKTIVL